VTGRKIKTRMLWWGEPNDNPATSKREPFKQKTIWDWGWSTVTTLSELPPKYKARLKAVDFDLKVKAEKADVECMAHSTAAGMGKDEWLTFSEVGALIQSNPDLMSRIRGALGIKRRSVMAGDYLQQLEGIETE
jgi:hypothetical protein